MHTLTLARTGTEGFRVQVVARKVNSQDVVRLYGQHVPVAPHAVEVRLNAINWLWLRGGDCTNF